MARKRIKRDTDKGSGIISDSNQDDQDDTTVQTKSSSLNVKDSLVIILLSTFLSISLVTATLGINGITEKLTQHDMLDVLMTVGVFIGLFAFVSYLLVKFACHYLVYFAITTFFAIIFPVSKRRRREAVKEIYDKAEKKE